MRVKLNWLRELVDLGKLSLEEIQHAISLYSIEVEGVERLIDASNLIVGRVMIREDHPDADKLSICTVNTGKEITQIVCGAPNVAAGQDVIVALPGAILPGNIEIKKTTIRGVESNGMICSLKEIGIDPKYVSTKYQDGIYYFEENVELGIPAQEALLLDDVVIELGVTPNRKDLLSMVGVAYEISAALKRKLRPITYDLTKELFTSKDFIDVEKQSSKCSLYFAHVVKDVVIKPSPNWLSSRLIAFGVRPINNVVDITNYILALYGQPLHSFDYDKLGSKIIVRQAKKNEAVMTLDEQFRKLDPEDLVIANGNGIVAIAGIMGASNTEVDTNTKNIVLEAAVFDPKSIRKTAAKLSLRSESSLRFEKGVDNNITETALNHALYLLQTLAEGKIAKESVSIGVKEIAPHKVKCTLQKVNGYLGIKLTMSEVKNALDRLHFEVIKSDKESLEVLIPNRRNDIELDVDLIEEIIRLYGYHNLPATLPQDAFIGRVSKMHNSVRSLKQTLVSLGVKEVINYSLQHENTVNKFNILLETVAKPIQLLMPLSEDKSTLRLSLVGSLLETLKYNKARKAQELAFFESSNLYYTNKAGELEEKIVLSGIFSGQYSYRFDTKEEMFDFYNVKGILETTFKQFPFEWKYVALNKSQSILHPKRSAWIMYKEEIVGFVGQLHPKLLQEEDLDVTFVFEVFLDKIPLKEKENIKFSALSKALITKRDLALLVDKDREVQDLKDAIYSLKDPILESVEVFDVYIGDKIKSNEKSVALSLIFSPQETVTEQEIQNKVTAILKVVEEQTGATLRK